MVKKLLIASVIAAIIAAVGLVSIGAGKIFPVEWARGPRGGMIELGILIFCASLVGLYWLIKVYIPGEIKKRRQNAQRNQDK